MSCSHIVQILSEIGKLDCVDSFRVNKVTVHNALLLNGDQLTRLGIPEIGIQAQFFEASSRLRATLGLDILTGAPRNSGSIPPRSGLTASVASSSATGQANSITAVSSSGPSTPAAGSLRQGLVNTLNSVKPERSQLFAPYASSSKKRKKSDKKNEPEREAKPGRPPIETFHRTVRLMTYGPSTFSSDTLLATFLVEFNIADDDIGIRKKISSRITEVKHEIEEFEERFIFAQDIEFLGAIGRSLKSFHSQGLTGSTLKKNFKQYIYVQIKPAVEMLSSDDDEPWLRKTPMLSSPRASPERTSSLHTVLKSSSQCPPVQPSSSSSGVQRSVSRKTREGVNGENGKIGEECQRVLISTVPKPEIPISPAAKTLRCEQRDVSGSPLGASTFDSSEFWEDTDADFFLDENESSYGVTEEDDIGSVSSVNASAGTSRTLTTNSDKDQEILRDILKELKVKLYGSTGFGGRSGQEETDFIRINVTRRHTWFKFSQLSQQKKLNNPFRVTFVNEPGSDAGGPTREFLRLALQQGLADCCVSSPAGLLLKHSAALLNGSRYEALGHLIVVSLLNGLPGPKKFSSCITGFLLDCENYSSAEIQDLPEEHFRAALEKIGTARTADEINEAVNGLDARFEAGLGYVVTMQNRSRFIRDFANFFVIHRNRSALEQLKKGLELADVLKTSEIAKPLFSNLLQFSTEEVESKDLKLLFNFIHAPKGSRKYELEEAAVMYIYDIWDQMDGGEIESTINGDTVKVTVRDFLVFVTGCGSIPPMGFDPRPSIEFRHHDTTPKTICYANTCSNSLQISLGSEEGTFDEFKEKFLFSFLNSPGFYRS